MIKAGVADIVGKTITSVIITKGRNPPCQLFLTFSDDTNYEFYSDYGGIQTTRRVDDGGRAVVLQYIGNCGWEIVFDSDHQGKGI